MIYLRSKTNVERLRSAFQRVDRNEQSAVLSNLVWKCRAILVPLPGTSDPPISSFFLHAKSTASPRDKSPPNSIPRPECHRYIPLKLIDRPSSWSEPLPDSSTSHAWFEIWRGIEAIFSFFFFFFLAIGSLFQSRGTCGDNFSLHENLDEIYFFSRFFVEIILFASTNLKRAMRMENSNRLIYIYYECITLWINYPFKIKIKAKC